MRRRKEGRTEGRASSRRPFFRRPFFRRPFLPSIRASRRLLLPFDTRVSPTLPPSSPSFERSRYARSGPTFLIVSNEKMGNTGSKGEPVTPTVYADPMACCLQHPSTRVINGTPCAEQYSGPTASACSPYFQTACASGKWGMDSDCGVWATQFPLDAHYAMTAHCRADPLTGECKAWSASSQYAEAQHRQMVGDYCTSSRLGSLSGCREMCRKYRGGCNGAAQDYCSGSEESTDGGFCSCLRSPAGLGIAECIDGKCYDQGYKMTEVPPDCPDQTVCAVYWNLKDIGGDVQFRNTSIVQQCGREGGGTTTTTTTGGEEDEEEEVEEEAGISLTDIESREDLQLWLAQNKALITLFAVAGMLILLTLIAAA